MEKSSINNLNKEILDQIFEKALEKLKEALDKDATEESVFVDGTIQRFEFTFEQAWKLAKVVLKYQGVEANTPLYPI